MLVYLKVEDFALIESAEVEFNPGFNALTGETGAGKTVLVGAIGLLLGERGDSMQVRHGAEKASFACAFDLSGLTGVVDSLAAAGYLEPGETELMLGRSISAQGKSRCTVNGRLAPVSALAEIGEALVDVHGQNTHQALLKAGTHLDYLDRFAGGAQIARLSEYKVHHAGLIALLKERESLSVEAGEGAREAELLAHEIEEIEEADPKPGDVELLEREAQKLRNARELSELGARARDAVAGDAPPGRGSARELLLQAEKDLRRMASHDGTLEALASRAESAAYEVEDIASGVDGYLERLESDPRKLEEVESRLSALRQLSRKYGGSPEAALAYRDNAVEKLTKLNAGKVRLEEIEGEIEIEKTAVAGLAVRMTEARNNAASELSKSVRSELGELELPGARFEVSVSAPDGGSEPGDVDGPGAYGPNGADSVEFLFSSEPKEPPRPLRRIASGGEMSRVMLALKIVLAGADRIPVLVFDEVDAGIGGETAVRVGEKLWQLTGFHQVFCVTHIPQIASFADWQYRVFRSREEDGTRTGVELLDRDGRVEEMCRMLGDSSGRKVTVEHARDLLERADAGKNPG